MYKRQIDVEDGSKEKQHENYKDWSEYREGSFVWADMIKRDLDACILQANGRLFSFDQDEDAARNIVNDERFTFVRSNFRYLHNFLRYYGVEKVDAVDGRDQRTRRNSRVNLDLMEKHRNQSSH